MNRELFNAFAKSNTDKLIDNSKQSSEVEPFVVSSESKKYKDMCCVENLSDDDGIGDWMITKGNGKIVYTSGPLHKTLKVLDRSKNEIVYSLEEPKNTTRMFMGIQEAQLGSAFSYHIGQDFEARNLDDWEFDKLYTVSNVGNYSQESLDGSHVISNEYGSYIRITDLSSGADTTVINPEYHYPAKAMVELPEGLMAVAFGKNIQILDKEKREYCLKIEGHTGDIYSLSVSQDGKELITASADKTVKIWDITTGKCIKSLDLPFSAYNHTQAMESIDRKHLIIGDGSKIRIYHKKNGNLVRIIDGKNFHQTSNGPLVVENNGRLQFWTWGIDEDHEPKETIFRGEKQITDEDRYNFDIEKKEVTEEAVWFLYHNLESRRLAEKKDFKWGEERLYFDIPIEDMEKLKDLIIRISQELKIPIAFKYLDNESSSESVLNGATRFVVNFNSVVDTKKLYEMLSKTDEYQLIQPDRQTDYFAYNLDGKAHYASGYREIRQDDFANFQKWFTQIIQNEDGSYSMPSVEGIRNISADEYEKMRKSKDYKTIFQEKWERIK